MIVYFATDNLHKFKEVRARLAELTEQSIIVKMLKPFYAELQSGSLYDTVKFKISSLKVVNKNSKIVIVDDSGLFIDALNGFPGVYSAYIYKTIGCKGILKLLASEKNRSAVFKCMIGVSYFGMQKFFKGICKGRIAYNCKGKGGFGFDPIFIPEGYESTFAQFSLEQKNQLSHRGIALQKLVKWLSKTKGSKFVNFSIDRV